MHMKTLLLCCVLFIVSTVAWSQREVTGQVMDGDSKAPIQGVNISVRNTRVGTTTDVDGKFHLSVPANAKTLVFSSTGFDAKEVNLASGETDYGVTLFKNVQALNEVIVAVAYGEQEKRNSPVL